MFNQHNFGCQIELNREIPKIFIKPGAFHKMEYYVSLSTNEISWLGTVQKLGENFVISDVYLVEQQVSLATTEMTKDGIVELGLELLSSGGIDLCSSLKFWGHSHCLGPTSPSGQDESQMTTFLTDLSGTDSYFIRAIVNKHGRMQFTLYLDGGSIVVNDAEWSLYYQVEDGLKDVVESEIAQKVSKMVPTFTGYGKNYLGYNPGDFYDNSIYTPPKKKEVRKYRRLSK